MMRRRFSPDGGGFFVLCIIACIVAIVASVFITIAVVNSNMPDWLKFLILS